MRLLIWSLGTGLLWISGAIAGGGTLAVMWVLALSLEVISPYVGYRVPGLGSWRDSDGSIEPGHFVERFQLFIIIVLGESIVLTGATAAALDLTTARLAAVVVAVALASVLWWLYFNSVAERSRQELDAASDKRVRLARDAYSYTYILLVFGIVLVAVGNELIVAHPLDVLDPAALAVVIAGPVLYLLGHAAFARVMTGRVRYSRVVGAVVIAAVGFVGTVLAALWTQMLILAILVGFAIHETAVTQGYAASPFKAAATPSRDDDGTSQEYVQ